jgi:hypothetical protein
MSTLRTSNLIHGSSSINNIVLDTQGRAIFGPNSAQGRASLYVNPQNNRVGINNESPAVALDVDGAINATGNVSFTGDLNIDNGTLFVDATSNRVGIGTTSPSTTLHVIGAADSYLILQAGTTDGNDGILFYNSAGAQKGVILFDTDDDYMLFSTNNTERMRIDSSGNVGIGTPTPTASDKGIDIMGTTEASVRLHTGNTGGTLTDGVILSVASTNDGYLWNYENSPFIFGTNNSERMRIDSNGKLVVGAASFISGANSFAQAMISGNVGGLIINSIDTSASSYCRLIFSPNGNIVGNEGLIRYNTNDFHMAFYTQGGERMRIDSLGRVGIGGTSTTSKLRVIGNEIRFSNTSNALYYGTITHDAGTTGANIYDSVDATNISHIWRHNGTEAMRIDGEENLYIGSPTYYSLSNYGQTTGTGNWLFRRDDASSVGGSVIHANRKGGFAGYYFNIFDWTSGEDLRWFDFYKNGATFSRIQLTANGNNIELTNQSDYRLKQDVSDYTGALEIVKQLKPKTYNWISNPEHPYKDTGFIAHELQEVLPDIVSGEKDEMGYAENLSEEGATVTANMLQPVYQSLDMTRLIPTLTAALKEAIAKIETLEQRLSDAGL